MSQLCNPTILARSVDISGDSNFPQGCAFSPDGLCVLTSTASDHRLRLYNTPPIPSVLKASSDEDFDSIDGNGVNDASRDDGEEAQDRANAALADAVTTGGRKVAHGDGAPKQSQRLPDEILPWRTALHASAGDSIRSYAWYPHMTSSDPSTCAFLSASRDQPIHLIDAYTSKIRASYRPYNALDEMESPTVVAFTPDGERIFSSGFRTDRTIHIFRTDMPGRDSDVLRLGKTRRSKDGQKGIVSALSFPQRQQCGGTTFGGGNPSVFAVGTYSPGSIYIYDDRMPSGGDPAGTVLHGGVCIVGHGKSFAKKKRRFAAMEDNAGRDTDDGDGETQDMFSAAKFKWYQSRARGGITQLSWSPTAEYILYSASRRSDAVLSWDVRMLSGDASRPIRGLASYARDGDTNQRLEFTFDECGQRLFVASRDETVKIYDLQSGKMAGSICGLDDTVNGVSYIPTSAWGHKGGLLAVATGARRFDAPDDEEDSSGVDSVATEKCQPPGSLEIFKVD